jgi:hypothetical protein
MTFQFLRLLQQQQLCMSSARVCILYIRRRLISCTILSLLCTLHAQTAHCNNTLHACTDVYTTIGDVSKLSCSRERPGESNGICNGFGACQCAPPFIGDDCSIRDCPRNCSFNGWCSVEFPVSHCACDPGYYGEACQYQVTIKSVTVKSVTVISVHTTAVTAISLKVW